MTSINNILVIDDDPQIGEFIAAAAESVGMSCIAATDIPTFLASLTPEVTPENTLIMLDLVMPNIDGIELLRLLGQRQCRLGIILMSGIGKRIIDTAEELAKSLNMNIIGQLPKPFRLLELEVMLARSRESVLGMARTIKTKVIIEDAELRKAIERSEFVLYYQPQVEISTARVVGVEALVRWNHPRRGLIFPDDFIAYAEALGVIDEISWIVAERGLSEISQFADKEGIAPTLSINISVQSLRDLAFPDKFLSLVHRYGVLPKDITLEITESGLIKELSHTLDVLARLRMKGVQLSVDDFGTGFAAMQQLRNIPATELKIDKSFVQNALASDGDAVMVQKTIEIGHALGMRVVAEGVETKEQLDFVRAYGCDAVQGYLFSKPLPLKDIVAWLADYRANSQLRISSLSGEFIDGQLPLALDNRSIINP